MRTVERVYKKKPIPGGRGPNVKLGTYKKSKPLRAVRVTSENSGYNVKGHRNPNPKVLKKAISGGYNKKPAVKKVTPIRSNNVSNIRSNGSSSSGRGSSVRSSVRTSRGSGASVSPKKTTASKVVTKKSTALPALAKNAATYYNQLKSTAQTYFGSSDEATIRKWANDIAAHPNKLDYYMRGVKAGNATTDPSAKRAGLTVSASLDPQIAAAQQYEQGVKNLYAGLSNMHNDSVTSVQNAGQASAADVNKQYDDLLSSIASQYGQAKDSSASEAARLGIQGVNNDSINQQQLLMSQLAQSGKANANQSVNDQNNAYRQIMSSLGSEEAAAGANYQQQSAQQRASLEAGRRSKVYTLYQQLLDQRRAEQAAAAQQAFANSLAQSKFGVYSDAQSAAAIKALADARKAITGG